MKIVCKYKFTSTFKKKKLYNIFVMFNIKFLKLYIVTLNKSNDNDSFNKRKQKSSIFVNFSSQLAQLTKLYVFQQQWLSNNDHVGCSAQVDI